MLLQSLAIMVLLLFVCENVRSATCPSSMTTTFSASTQLDSFTSYTNVEIKNAEVGSVSGALYLMYSLSSGSAAAFVKLNQDGSFIWSKSVNHQTLTKSLAVDNAEHNVYFIQYSSSPPMIVVRLNAADGTLTDAQSHPTIAVSYSDYIRVHVLSDNSGYYVIMRYTSDAIPHAMKYLFSSPTSNQNYKLVGTFSELVGTLKITDTEFFCISFDNSINVVFVKFTFTNTSADWTRKMTSSAGSGSLGHSESLMSRDKSKIYSLLSYSASSPSNIYLTIFKTSDGTILGSRYQSNSNCYDIYGFILNGDNIITSLVCSSQYYLMIYNIYLDSFTYRLFIGSSLFDLAVESGSGMIQAFGSKSSKGYIAKFPLNSLSLMTDFTSTSSISTSIFTGSILNSAVTFTLQIDPVIDYTSSVTVSGATYSSNVQYIPDYYLQTINQNYSLLESTSKIITPNITCSFSGLTSITYSIINYINPAPSWITINPTSGLLSIVSPSVASDTTYSFYIKSTVSGVASPVQILMSVTVLNCAVDFCTTCSSSATVCAICNTGYNLSITGTCNIQANSTSASTNSTSGSVQEASVSAKTQSTITVSITSLSATIISISGFANTSSLSSLWSMFNQIQILYLLLLSRADLPEDVKAVIAGSKVFSNPSLSIPFQKMPFYHTVFQKFDWGCSNSDFETFGLSSDSSVSNTGSFFIFFLVLLVLHILIILIKKLFEFCCTCNICRCPRATFRWIVDKCLAIMTYGYYIRFVMQMNQFLLVASFYEIYNFDLSNIFNIMSFIFALLVLLFCMCYTCVVCYLSLSSYKMTNEGRNKIGEFFMGIKIEKKYKFFASVLIMRRTFFIVLLICLMSISSRFLVVILSFIQLAYLLYVIFMRPYIEVKGNIVEIINEIYFLFLLSHLSVCNGQNEWTSSRTSIYCFGITSNSFVILIIVLVDSARIAIIKCKERSKTPIVPDSHSIQLTPEFLRSIGAPPIKRVAPKPQNATQLETDINRNNTYMYEENKIYLEDNVSVARLERRKF